MRALRHLFQIRRRYRQSESRFGQVLKPTKLPQNLVSIVSVPAQLPQGTFRYASLLPTELAVSCCEHCRVPRASALAPLSSKTRHSAIGQSKSFNTLAGCTDFVHYETKNAGPNLAL
jgi:hypothetical protein